jgi:broad specificity phosphatase PhoE
MNDREVSFSWPSVLWIVRHGQSLGNVAAEAARLAGYDRIDIEPRDADVALSMQGRHEAEALGRWLSTLPVDCLPTCVLASPFRRARETAAISLDVCGGQLAATSITIDERLRDRDLGSFDRLTQLGIQNLFPDEAQVRRRLGKFYHRPPGGESWTDVASRLRGVVDRLRADFVGERVIVFAHDVVVLLFRYILEGLDEETLLAVQQQSAVANGGITMYQQRPGEGLVLRAFNATVSDDGEIDLPPEGAPTCEC